MTPKIMFPQIQLCRAVKIQGSQHCIPANLSTSASRELSSLLGFPSSTWPYASAVVRELLSGVRSQPKTSSVETVAEDVSQSSITTAAAEARQPNSDLVQLLQICETTPPDREDLSRQVTGSLQRLCPQLEHLSPAEVTQLVEALGHLQVKDSLVDIVLEAVRSPPPQVFNLILNRHWWR